MAIAFDPYVQRGGTMTLVPAQHVCQHFQSIFATELNGFLPIKYGFNDAKAAQHVAQKIFLYHFLKFLADTDAEASMSIIGRFYYIPSDKCSQSVSRIGAGIVTLPGVGAYITSLAHAGMMTITKADGTTRVYQFTASTIPIFPLEGVKKINLWFSSEDSFDLTEEVLPLKQRSITPCDPSTRESRVKEISNKVLVLALAHLDKLPKEDSQFIPGISEALERTCLLPPWVRSEGDFDTSEDSEDSLSF